MTFRAILISFLTTLLLTTISFAQPINLYEQPDANSKISGKADTAKGIIPIYKPQTGEWIKVADPTNGNVGWIKQSDLNKANEARTVQMIRYGKENKLSESEMRALVKRMQQQQESLQRSFQNIFNSMNKLFDDEWQRLKQDGTFPIIMPIMVTPDVKAPTTPNHAPVNKQQPEKPTTNTNKQTH